MITELPRDEVIEAGARYQGENLIEQSGYSTGIAAAEGAPMVNLLPANYQTEVKTLIDQVRDKLKDREYTEQEAKFATQSQNTALRRAKQWMRKAARRAKRAGHMGKRVPDILLAMPNETKITDLARRMDEAVNEFEKNLANIPGGDNAQVLADGKVIAKAFLDADSAQEIKRLKDLPAKIQDYYYQKGLLYIGLKVINEAGRELYLDDPEKAGKYNMKILYRHVNHGARPEAVAPGP